MTHHTPNNQILAFFSAHSHPAVRQLVMRAILDEEFQLASGAGSPDKHHYGDGGLLIHTYEVVRHALALAETHHKMTGENLRIDELLVAAVWHDYGKIWDYERTPTGWQKTKHAREIHHISRSVLELQSYVTQFPDVVPQGFDIDHVFHMILSHHGRREWGSPVAPHTQEAWILHLADGVSARLNDHKTHRPF
jgi:3'-5' exoribonuclease